jgi:hypothetical protein
MTFLSIGETASALEEPVQQDPGKFPPDHLFVAVSSRKWLVAEQTSTMPSRAITL